MDDFCAYVATGQETYYRNEVIIKIYMSNSEVVILSCS